jgi:hypothetical protein
MNDCCPPNSKHRSDQQAHNAKCLLCDKTEYERGLCTTHYGRYHRAVQNLPLDQRESFEAAQIAAGKILPSRRGQGPRRKQVAPFEDNEWAEFPASTKQAMRGTSKRKRWKAATFYLKPETLAQLRRVILEWKLEGLPGDFSDAVEEALEAWLSQQDK